MTTIINYIKTLTDAKTPRQSLHSKSYILYTPKPIIINPGETVLVDTGIVLVIDTFYYAWISRNLKYFQKYKVAVNSHIIDNENCKNSICISLHNIGKNIAFFSKHDPIAQVMFIYHYGLNPVPNTKLVRMIPSLYNLSRYKVLHCKKNIENLPNTIQKDLK